LGGHRGLVRHVAHTRFGALEVFGERIEECRRGAEIALERAPAVRGEMVAWSAARAYFKGSPLHGGARARWAVKHALLRQPLPRVRELLNLHWLRARVFQAPRPLCTGVLTRGGVARYQFLLTEEVVGARTLDVFLRTVAPGSRERAEVLAELACEVARMHALGFVHHDLYARNILVVPGVAHARLSFIDAWAGGPPPQWRSRAYDVACLLLRAPSTWEPSEIETFLARYFAERKVQDRPVEQHRFLGRMQTQRRRLIDRLRSRPHELRDEPLPDVEISASLSRTRDGS